MDPITGFFALLISILAICSMFAIFGIKKRLDTIYRQQRDMLKYLQMQTILAKKMAGLELVGLDLRDYEENILKRSSESMYSTIKAAILRARDDPETKNVRKKIIADFKISNEEFSTIYRELQIDGLIK